MTTRSKGRGAKRSGGVRKPNPNAKVRQPQKRSTAKADAEGTMRAGTKLARLIAMLRRAEGATIAEAAKALGWQPHTVCGALAGALKKRLGLTVTSDKVEGRGRLYRVTG